MNTCTCHITENGTHFNSDTEQKVRNVLQNARQFLSRVKIHYGDTATGRDWNEVYDVAGTIGRSTGNCKVPLLIPNVRSTGGGAILTHCIVKITESKKPHNVLYQHTNYHQAA